MKHGLGVAFVLALCIGFVVSAERGRSYLDKPMPLTWAVDSVFSERRDDRGSQWWLSFDDELLDSLINVGMRNSATVAEAAHNIAIARAALGAARSAYYPQIDVGLGWNKSQTAGNPLVQEHYWLGGVTASWEIDLFGKITAQSKQKGAEVKVSIAEYEGVLLSLQAEIATTYVQLRMWQLQLDVALQHIERQLKIVKITEARYEAMLASMLDVAQAKTVYYSTYATTTQLRTSIATAVNALALLVGDYPDALAGRLAVVAQMPEYHQIVSLGVPMDLLRNRPDVVEAERKIEAMALSLGIARKDWLPTLTLTGEISTQGRNLNDMFKRHSYSYEIAPKLSWTMFDGFARKYNTTEARYQMESAVESYNLAVMTAVQDVDNAIVTYTNALRYISDIETVVEYSRQAEELSIDRYKQGLTDMTSVANAQMSYLEYQTTLISAQGQAAVALVTLYKALGGKVM
jgi:NodT family efflux transporter outer membrane factor (OMF) lipoprotein